MSEVQNDTGAGAEDEIPELTRAQKAAQARVLFEALPPATKAKAVLVTGLTLLGTVFAVKSGVKVVRAGIRRVRR
jgi:hypothetical protein